MYVNNSAAELVAGVPLDLARFAATTVPCQTADDTS